tara:strand:- start:5964 stop:6905 length:942 start_codon:yes stop_codon:yes gene_type:complete
MSEIFIAGHNGMVGSAILKILKSRQLKICFEERKNLDLMDTNQVESYFKKRNIDQVFLCAAKVGGIKANNKFPANFLYENIMIQANIINTAYKSNVKKLLFLGSSCIYPKKARQPLKEDYLLNGKLEKTNEAYAIAKISGLKMCEFYSKQFNLDYRTVMPTNLYGPRDNFDLESSHVIPGIIRKLHEAKINNNSSINLWGTGKPKREFLYVDDLAEACCFIMDLEKEEFNEACGESHNFLNIGYGKEISIYELSKIISEVVGYKGKIFFDSSKLDGTQQKLLDSNLLNSLGWRPKTHLKEGLIKTYKWFLDHQ